MYPCRIQEAVITVNPTSRYGQTFDIAHVETIFLMDNPIPENEIFLVPSDENIPVEILNLIRLAKVSFAPIPKSEITASISDLTQEVEQGQKEAVLTDTALSLAAVYMRPITFQPIGNNFYRLSYDYKLFPDTSGNFYIYTKLPFRGFDMPQGSQVRFITVLPTGVQVDEAETKGIDLNQQIINEQLVDVASGRRIISFFWQNDPDFTIKYRY